MTWGVSVSESMSPRSAAVVPGSVYSPSDPLFLFGLLWFSRGASACRLEEVPGSIKSAKTLVTRHIEQRVVNTHNPSAYFPSISEHFSPPSRNMHGNFITEERSYTTPRRTHDADKLKTSLQIDAGHKITKNNGYIVLATTRKPTPRIGYLTIRFSSAKMTHYGFSSVPCWASRACPRSRCVCVSLLQDLLQSCSRGGGGEWRTCAMKDDEPRPVWMMLPITH